MAASGTTDPLVGRSTHPPDPLAGKLITESEAEIPTITEQQSAGLHVFHQHLNMGLAVIESMWPVIDAHPVLQTHIT
jgi:hypothetical protein